MNQAAKFQINLCFIDSLEIKAKLWIDTNPEIYGLFRKFAFQALKTGRHFGMKALAERVRWECNVEWGGSFKVNNNFVTYIGRRLIREYPELKPLIETRKTRS